MSAILTANERLRRRHGLYRLLAALFFLTSVLAQSAPATLQRRLPTSDRAPNVNLPESIRSFKFNAPVQASPFRARRRGSAGGTNAALGNDSEAESEDEVESESLELSPVVLVITIDGQVHALRRETGQWLWTLHNDDDAASGGDARDERARKARAGRALGGPLVRSSSPRLGRPASGGAGRQGSANDTSLAAYDTDREEDETFIIEPSADGDIYVYSREGGTLQKLPLSMQQLVAYSPFTFPSDASRMFVGRKETKLVGVDLKTGRLVGVFGSGAGWCEWDALRDGRVKSEEECDEDISKRPEDLLYMARTEYHLSIYAKTSSALLQTLTYTTYSSSSLTSSMAARWTATPDGRYLQPMHDGSLLCFVAGQQGIAWSIDFDVPVISVFDIATPSAVGIEGTTEVPQPVMFKQPHPQIVTGLPTAQGTLDALPDTAFIGQYDDELFAMSKQNYPLTAFAPPRNVEIDDELAHTDEDDNPQQCRGPSCIMGRHSLSPSVNTGPNQQIEAPEVPLAIDPAPAVDPARRHITDPTSPATAKSIVQRLYHPSSAAPSVILAALLVLATVIYLKRRTSKTAKRDANRQGVVLHTDQAAPVQASTSNGHARQLSLSKELPPLPTVTITEPASNEDAQGDADDDQSADEQPEQDDAAPKRKSRRRRGKKGKHKKVLEGATAVASDPVSDVPNNDLQAISLADVPLDDQETESVPVKPASVGSLCVSNTILGYGSHGTVVLRGEFQGRAVAVKRLLKDFVTIATHEVNLLVESDDHPHVIRYFCNEQKDNFLYIALELCPASLYDIVEQPTSFPDLSREYEPKRALRQITSGIRHLHKLKIVHRDIKPQNILVAPNKRGGGVRMLISDFGLCKKLDLDESSFQQTMHHAAGSFGYRAPEVLRGQVDPNAIANNGTNGSTNSLSQNSTGSDAVGRLADPSLRLTRSIDIFSLGCIFYYALTKGEHPFGSRYEREINILRANVSLDRLDGLGEEAVEAQDIISRMVAADPRDRPTAESILLHPFFWNAQRRLLFLCDASDRFEIMDRDPPDETLVALESKSGDVVGDDWQKAIDRSLLDNLGKYRKYDGSSVRDLLRVLRNKKHHYQDLPEQVRKQLGDLPGGFLSYFTLRFPLLVLHVHDVVKRHLADEAMFSSIFSLPEEE